eukprot:14110102-Alexandrium_andersonii.AAC.1
MVSGVRTLNCGGPGMASKLARNMLERCIYAACFAQMPNLPTKRAGGGPGGAFRGGSGGADPPGRH